MNNDLATLRAQLDDFEKSERARDPDGDIWGSPEGQRLLAEYRKVNRKELDKLTAEERFELMMKPQPRFCKDCRWFRRDMDGLHVCLHSKARIETQDLVEGEIVTDMLYCSSMRVKGGVCGQEGRLWEENL